MARRRGDPGWRDKAAAELAARWIRAERPCGRALVVGDRRSAVADALGRVGAEVRSWGRRIGEGAEVAARPPAGPFDLVALRMPRSKPELAMLAHQVAGRMSRDGGLLLYGARDEGVASASRVVEPPFTRGESVATGGRCRLLRFRRNPGARARTDLEEWAQPVEDAGAPRGESPASADADGGGSGWITYPGVFAGARVDPGTALLLDHVETPPPGSRVLDFGCGWGVIGATLATRAPGLDLTLLDVDAVALEAARRNVPGATAVLGDGLDAASGAFDRIVANPPYHEGKGETLSVVESLIRGAPGKLAPRGTLTLVVQRRFRAGPVLEAAFGSLRVLAENRTYRVWEARR